MTLELREYNRGLVACAWCGNVKDKKIEVTGTDEGKFIVCRKHFTKQDGSLMNVPTADAIIRVRAWSHVR